MSRRNHPVVDADLVSDGLACCLACGGLGRFTSDGRFHTIRFEVRGPLRRRWAVDLIFNNYAAETCPFGVHRCQEG